MSQDPTDGAAGAGDAPDRTQGATDTTTEGPAAAGDTAVPNAAPGGAVPSAAGEQPVTLLAAARVITCDPARATASDPLGVLERGAVALSGGRLVAVGRDAELRARFPDAPLEVYPDFVITPGLVDAHTHAAWVGSRSNEYAMRMAGADYEAIARAGGGIVASMRAVRAADPGDVAVELFARARRMRAMGVTTVEVKSGYGLDRDGELKQLAAIRTLASARGDATCPRVVPTFLGLHALPPEANGDRAAYARHVTEAILPLVARHGLARYADAYVDRSAFSVAEARPFLEKARALGLGVRVHAGQFADVGGAEMAADLGAATVDHLENVGPAGIARLAEAGVRAVLLPVASFTLKQDPPPVAALREAGVRMVVASDANPGTAPTESLPLAMALALRMYGLTVAEVLLGATREAAASLGLGGATGVLREGFAADLVVWDLPHETALLQPWGLPRAHRVYRDGIAPEASPLSGG